MKTFLLSVFFFFGFIQAGTITVSATVDGKGFKAKKNAKKLVKQEAVKKYALSKNKSIPQDALEELGNSNSEFILFLTQNSKEYDRSEKKSTFSYTVEIDDQAFNKKFSSLGLSVQGQSTKLVILEDPLNLSNVDFFTTEDFIIYYNDLQKQIKNIITSKLNENGFSVTNLENEKKFSKFKSKSQSLSGVYYDHKRAKYATDNRFISQVIQEYPEVIFIKYKLELLMLGNSNVKAKISMKLTDVEGNNEVSLGDLSYSTPLDGHDYTAVKDSFSLSIKNIISLLTNELNEKVDEIVVNKNNKPVTFVMSMPNKRSAYQTKSMLGSMNNVFDIVLQENELVFYAKDVDRDEFLYGRLLQGVEDILNKTIDEEHIEIRSKKVIINTSGKEFNQNSKLQILFI